MVPFWTKQTQTTFVMWQLIGLNRNETILYAIHQHTEKHIYIHCKVAFDFKYMFFRESDRSVLQTYCID